MKMTKVAFPENVSSQLKSIYGSERNKEELVILD